MYNHCAQKRQSLYSSWVSSLPCAPHTLTAAEYMESAAAKEQDQESASASSATAADDAKNESLTDKRHALADETERGVTDEVDQGATEASKMRPWFFLRF